MVHKVQDPCYNEGTSLFGQDNDLSPKALATSERTNEGLFDCLML